MTSETAAIRVDDLTVAYGEKPVLWDIDLEVPRGVLMAIVGPNGAGKTTVIRTITGLGLKESKELVEGAPKAVKEGVTKEEAEEIKGSESGPEKAVDGPRGVRTIAGNVLRRATTRGRVRRRGELSLDDLPDGLGEPVDPARGPSLRLVEGDRSIWFAATAEPTTAMSRPAADKRHASCVIKQWLV